MLLYIIYNMYKQRWKGHLEKWQIPDWPDKFGSTNL